MKEEGKFEIRKVVRYNNKYTVLNIGRFLPKEWEYVKIKVLSKDDNKITLELEKV